MSTAVIPRVKPGKRKSLVAYLTALAPDELTCMSAVKALVAAGVDMLEIGVPFSEPVADGPVIEAAMQEALKHGVNLRQTLAFIKNLRQEGITIPIILFSYLNPLLYHGFKNTCKEAQASGVNGLLIVDIPLEESWPFKQLAQEFNLTWPHLITPATSKERLPLLIKEATGFLYVVSMLGVTGGKLVHLERLQPLLTEIKHLATLPTYIGFGIHDSDSALAAAKISDGVIIGSAIVKLLLTTKPLETKIAEVTQLIRGIRTALDTLN